VVSPSMRDDPPEGLFGSELSVDYVFMPTYLAVAILTRVKVDFPHLADAIELYDEKLARGCRFACGRGLQGRGLEALRGMIRAFDVLVRGKVLTLLKSRPAFSPELVGLLRQIREKLTRALAEGDVRGDWNNDYTEQYRRLVGQLEGL